MSLSFVEKTRSCYYFIQDFDLDFISLGKTAEFSEQNKRDAALRSLVHVDDDLNLAL